jgi:hypothetical protein
MKSNFFEIIKPKFISIKEQRFSIDGTKYAALNVNIQDLIPVRKFFSNGKLICYAINSNISSLEKHCSLCADKFKCFMKVRIMMRLNNISNQQIPAALEVGKKDFQSLQKIIDTISENELHKENIKITFLNKKIIFIHEN